MRIISTFTDYYDSVQSMGMDKSCVYMRKEHLAGCTVSQKFEELAKEMLKKDKWSTFYAKEYRENRRLIEFDKILLGFCGKVYLLFKFEHIHNWESKESHLFYTVDDAQAYFEKIKKDYPYYNEKAYLSLRKIENHTLKLERDEFYRKKLDQDFTDCFHSLNAPSFIYPARAFNNKKYLKFWKSKGYREQYGEYTFWINPCLKDIHFFQIKDPYSAYQEIYQFLSGVLGNKEETETPMTNLEKVNQHGFDAKYGFRNWPGFKKKRKKKKNH